MRKYRNTKTGRIVTTTCKVNGKQWEELLEDQAPDHTDEDDAMEDQAPAKPAKKGKKQ